MFINVKNGFRIQKLFVNLKKNVSDLNKNLELKRFSDIKKYS